MPNFAKIAQPRIELTRKNTKFVWTSYCQEAFQGLKVCVTNYPTMGCPSPSDVFNLDMHASFQAQGSVLSQVQDEKERVIAYVSKSLS